MDWVWTNKVPEEEGYYWYRDEHMCDIVRVHRTYCDEELKVTGTALHERQPIGNLPGEWAGPIPEPNNHQLTS